jgi:hypothetical protein
VLFLIGSRGEILSLKWICGFYENCVLNVCFAASRKTKC